MPGRKKGGLIVVDSRIRELDDWKRGLVDDDKFSGLTGIYTTVTSPKFSVQGITVVMCCQMVVD